MIIKNKVLNYIKKKKYLIFLKKYKSTLKYLKKNIDKNDLHKINHLIITKNKSEKTKVILHKIYNIIKTKNKNNKAYQLLLKYKNCWVKINKNFILNKYIDNDRIYLWFAYVLNELLYIDFKKKNILNYKIKENNLYIKLKKIITLNIDKILINYTEKMQKSLINKIKNKKIYYITVNRIIKTCLKAKILYKKTIKYRKKRVNYIILNKKIFNPIFKVILSESIQLPTLIPIQYTMKDNILININDNYTLKYNYHYLEALNYLNSQKIRINIDYLKYLLKMTPKQIYKFSKKSINLKFLKKSKYNNKMILSYIFINNLFIINKYKKHVFYFKYKCDSRGRIYQENWPMNSLYNKMLSPLFIFQETLSEINTIKPNFDTYYWYKAHIINKDKIVSLRDATNSIFQIVGCLLLDPKMLKYSNIHNDKEPYSIYDYILDLYNKDLEILINLILEEYKNINNILINKIKNIDRKFLKNLIMTWCYNQSYQQSAKKIYEHIFLNKKKKWIIINNENNKRKKEIFLKISRIIHKYIFDIFKINFNQYIIFKKFINLIAKSISLENQSIKIKHNNISKTHFFEQHQYEQNFKKIYIETLFKKKKILYFNEINKEKISIKDNKRSLAPNIIQYLDSQIAVNVILQCKSQKIPIITNHDCFYTTIKNDIKILNIYNNVLKKLFIEHNFIDDLIIENNLLENEKIKNIYLKINRNRKKNTENINKIFSNKIEYSIFIKNKEKEFEQEK